MIVYLAMFISRFTGEKFPDSSRPMNRFDGLFLHAMGMSVLGYAIAIPFLPRGQNIVTAHGRRSHGAHVGSDFVDCPGTGLGSRMP